MHHTQHKTHRQRQYVRIILLHSIHLWMILRQITVNNFGLLYVVDCFHLRSLRALRALVVRCWVFPLAEFALSESSCCTLLSVSIGGVCALWELLLYVVDCFHWRSLRALRALVVRCWVFVDTVGWVIFHWPVKSSPKWPILCRVGR